MENLDRRNLLNRVSNADSAVVEAIIHLLDEEDKEKITSEGRRIKNDKRGNILPKWEKGDVKMKLTSASELRFLAYLGSGDPNSDCNFQVMGGFDMNLPD